MSHYRSSNCGGWDEQFPRPIAVQPHEKTGVRPSVTPELNGNSFVRLWCVENKAGIRGLVVRSTPMANLRVWKGTAEIDWRLWMQGQSVTWFVSQTFMTFVRDKSATLSRTSPGLCRKVGVMEFMLNRILFSRFINFVNTFYVYVSMKKGYTASKKVQKCHSEQKKTCRQTATRLHGFHWMNL